MAVDELLAMTEAEAARRGDAVWCAWCVVHFGMAGPR